MAVYPYHRLLPITVAVLSTLAMAVVSVKGQTSSMLGREISVPEHLRDGQEDELEISRLIQFGEKLFSAKWTVQEGAGRPASKGNAIGSPLSDSSAPLSFPRNFNRLSGPDANSCSGCHNEPFKGGGGDRVANVFVLANRFDFVTFDPNDSLPLSGGVDERGQRVTLQTVGNERKTIGMNGSGYIELLAREMTADLQSVRDALPAGHSRALVSKGVIFGTLKHNLDGSWDTTAVTGLPVSSLMSGSAEEPPSLLILPFHQSGADVSIRQFTNDAFNQHFGIQSEERFGLGVDKDEDGFVNELTRADVTAATLYQATLSVPGRVIPEDTETKRAALNGERRFKQVGCSTCHIPRLPLNGHATYSEPGPYNPPGNLQQGQSHSIRVDLSSSQLPSPRIRPDGSGTLWVEAFTDMKLHDITSGPADPNREPLDEGAAAGTPAFFAGNGRFITRRLWGVGNSGPYMHHGDFTTMREAILAHSGEALASRQAFQGLSDYNRDSIIEFLKTLQILPLGSTTLVVDNNTQSRECLLTQDTCNL